MGQARPIERLRTVTAYTRPASDIERTYYAELIGAFVRRRVELGLTQEQLDQMLGVAEGQVAKWESFTRLPGAFLLVVWGNALGVSLAAVYHAHTGE